MVAHGALQLPGEAALADAGDAEHGCHVTAPFRRGRVEQAQQLEQLRVTAHEGSGVSCTTTAGRPIPEDRDECRDPLRLSLEAQRTGRRERDSGSIADGMRGPIVDDDRRAAGRGLEAGGRVDDVAAHQALPLGNADRRLPGGDGGPRREARAIARCGQLGNCGDEVERRPNGSLRVVLVGHRRAPHRHHGVTDELLDRPSIGHHRAARDLEVA